MGRHHRHAALEAQQRHNVLLMLRALLAAYAVPPNCELLSALRLGAAGHPDVWVRPVKAASSAGCWHRLDHTTISFHDSNSFRKLLQQLSDVRALFVWELVAGHWHRATGEELDLSSPLQTIAGLRNPPATGCESATAAWKAREPAWRLLHSATLLACYSCVPRGQVHVRSEGGATTQKREEAQRRQTQESSANTSAHRRMQDRLEFEYHKAVHAEGIAGRRGARALSSDKCVTTDICVRLLRPCLWRVRCVWGKK